MGSPRVIDLEQMLTAIPGDNAAGRPLRSDFSPTSVYHAVKDARTAARSSERSQVWNDDASDGAGDAQKQWKRLLELGPQIIAEEAKDLEVAAWLTEALVRAHGYPGLRDGFRLLTGLIDTFWDGLYPMPDEDGMATRLAPVVGLNGEDSEGVLLAPVGNIPITAAGGHRPLSLTDYRRALDLDRLDDPAKQAQRIEQGAVTLAVFDKAVLESGREFYANLSEDMDECSNEFEKLCAVLEEKCGPSAPPSSAIRGALENAKSDLRGVVRRLFGEDEVGESSEGDAAMVSLDGRPGLCASAVRTREDAFRMLLQVADYFKHAEPHSPVAYALEQAVRWGRMPLPDLLAELIPEQSAREQIFKIVGIQRPSDS